MQTRSINRKCTIESTITARGRKSYIGRKSYPRRTITTPDTLRSHSLIRHTQLKFATSYPRPIHTTLRRSVVKLSEQGSKKYISQSAPLRGAKRSYLGFLNVGFTAHNHRPKTCDRFYGSNAFPKEYTGCKLAAH
jgi:hypothetical protein